MKKTPPKKTPGNGRHQPPRAESLLLTQIRLSAALSGTSSLAHGLSLCLDAALEVSGMDCGGIFLVNETRDMLRLEVHHGLGDAFVRSQKRIPKSSPFFAAALAGLPRYMKAEISFINKGLPPSSPERREELKAIAAIPVLAKRKVVALLNLGSHTMERIPKPVRQALEAVTAQIGLSLTRLQAESNLRNSHAELRALAARLTEIQENERRRIARDLHDQVGQSMTGLALSLNRILEILPPGQDAALREGLDRSVLLLEQATDRIRGVVADLRPPLLDDYGLAAALEWSADEFSKKTGVPITAWIEPSLARLPPNVENALFRIVQECLTNIEKHARASKVVLSLEASPKTIFLRIKDDGVGFASARAGKSVSRLHWGLSIIRERATAIGGRFRVVATPGGGVQILVEAPR